ncbi:crotonase/enoyl-CoA hydratase family protein [Salinisphaera aquimarina]|uniref:Crotonase/enoyl-CoA hydratase family protein n=1 Tax=Salinisphaera aquimarina TaxID=2094031 RepID=A0ABV7EK67_9GAMM
MSQSETVVIERQADVAHVCLNRPDKHNGMNFEMLDAVNDAARTLAKDRALRAIVLQGAGPSFCAGLDFKAVFNAPLAAAPALAQLWLPYANRFQRWSLGWRDIGVPVVAAVHGNCFGAGLQLALGADIRVARPDARLSVMEAKWGLIPDMGGVALLRELMSIDQAKRLTLSARVIDGREAERIGLVTHLADDPLVAAAEIADEMSRYSPDAVAAGKFLLQEAWQSSESQATAAERKYQRRLIGRANQRISIERNSSDADKPFRKRRIDS